MFRQHTVTQWVFSVVSIRHQLGCSVLSVQCSVFSELPSVQCAQCSAAKTACNAVFNVKYMLSTKTAPDAVSIVNNEQDACSAQYALCSI